MVNRFTPKAQAALSTAKKWAEKMGHSYIGSEHLILGILSCESLGKRILEEKHILFEDIYQRLVEIAGKGRENSVYVREMTPKCKKIVERSAEFARRYSANLIGTEHLLFSICDDPDSVGGRLLSLVGGSLQGIKNEITSYLENNVKRQASESADMVHSPLLSAHGKSLTAMAQKGHLDPLIGRGKEVERLIQVLCRRTKNNPCLIGEPGVGKTSIVEGLAQRINAKEVPSELFGKTIVSLDLPSMIAGTKYRGEFEERMKGLIGELKANRDVILFIDEIHTIMGAGAAEGAVDAANILKPALARGQLRLIGATTFDEYRRYIEKDTALERRFQPITVNEPTSAEAYEMLLGLRKSYEDYHGVRIPDSVLMHAIELSVRYINDRYLPDKAIDVIDEACSRVKTSAPFNEAREIGNRLALTAKEKEAAILDDRFEDAKQLRAEEASLQKQLDRLNSRTDRSQKSFTELTDKDIESVISQWSTVPLGNFQDNESFAHIEHLLSQQIIGQDEAVEAVSSSLKRGKAGLKSPNKPIGSFLFVGPTGVGKTELAKAIAQTVFKTSDSLIRFDMSEFSEKHSISRLVGSPPGYVGYEEGGALTKAVKKSPYSVVLLDEIEKAHPDIYNLLLQILDEGVLTDSSGRRVSFKNTVVILTSNLSTGSSLSSPLGFGNEASQKRKEADDHLSAVQREFKPELLNRLDEIIVFHPLKKNHLEEIAARMLNEVKELSRQIGIELNYDPDIAKLIVERGYRQGLGARPIRRAVTNLIETPLSNEILSLSVKKGDDVSVICENGEIKFKVLNTV